MKLNDIGDAPAPPNTSDLPSDIWSEIMAEGGLQPNDQGAIEQEIDTYRQTRTAKTTTRRKIEQVRGGILKVMGLLGELADNAQFLKIGVHQLPGPNFGLMKNWCDLSVQLAEEMERADARLNSGPEDVIYPPWGALGELVHGVLMIQARSKKTSPPTTSRNSSTHRQFEKFVYLCAQAADPDLKFEYPTVRNKKIDRALMNVTKSFRSNRGADIESWPETWDYTAGPEDT
jgi:hypothetical protein